MGEYDLTLGVLLVAILFNTYLFGVVTVQFVTYYERGFRDPWGIRLAVATLLTTDIFHSAALMYMAWGYFVTNFNNPAIIGVALWPYPFTAVLTGVSAIITHVFLGYRIYRLTKWRWLFIIFLLGAIASFSAAVASGVRAWLIKDMSKLSALNSLVTCWLTFQMVLDIAIAFVMAWVLWKSKTCYKSTNNVIHRLIRDAIQIGVFSAVFACGDLICFVGSPKTQLYGLFAIPLGRIYTNTLMHTLNMREELQRILGDAVESTMPSSLNKTKSIQIYVHDTKTTQVDGVDGVVNTQGEATTRSGGDVKLSTHTHET